MAPPLPPVKMNSGAISGNNNQSGSGHYDAATVEQIKAQFQAQIEAMMLSQVGNCSILRALLLFLDTTNGGQIFSLFFCEKFGGTYGF